MKIPYFALLHSGHIVSLGRHDCFIDAEADAKRKDITFIWIQSRSDLHRWMSTSYKIMLDAGDSPQ
jgi:hypothetical protein